MQLDDIYLHEANASLRVEQTLTFDVQKRWFYFLRWAGTSTHLRFAKKLWSIGFFTKPFTADHKEEKTALETVILMRLLLKVTASAPLLDPV